MEVHNKLFYTRKKQQRKLEKEKLAENIKPVKKHLFLTS
jgi:hypothetical protein